MSSISFMKKLLDGVAVEWKALGDIGHIVTGRTPKSSDKSAWGDEIDFVTPSDIKNGMRSITCPSRRLSVEGAASMIKAQIPSGSLLVTCIGADMGKTVINTNDCITNQQINAIILTDDSVQNGYLFHVLTAMRDTLRRQGELGGGTMPLINKSDFSKVLAPIPCPDNPKKSLEIQAEIVRILDTFTELTNELTNELTARKKQYNYYRDQLLSFEEGEVEWKTLLDACDYVDYRGKTPTKTQEGIFLVTARNIRMGYIDYEASQEFISVDNYDEVMRRGLPKKGDVLITTEAPCGFVAQIDRENIALAQRVIKYRSKDKRLSNSFLKNYLLGSQFQNKLSRAATGSTVKGIKGSKLHQLTVPIPSEAEQARIVAILDKFDSLTNPTTEGLPREIALRQQQYEYYRDLLLSFPKPDAEVAA
jgi:type I restriction enzyme S subunit